MGTRKCCRWKGPAAAATSGQRTAPAGCFCLRTRRSHWSSRRAPPEGSRLWGPRAEIDDTPNPRLCPFNLYKPLNTHGAPEVIRLATCTKFLVVGTRTHSACCSPFPRAGRCHLPHCGDRRAHLWLAAGVLLPARLGGLSSARADPLTLCLLSVHRFFPHFFQARPAL